jgi:hypothetical protein
VTREDDLTTIFYSLILRRTNTPYHEALRLAEDMAAQVELYDALRPEPVR